MSQLVYQILRQLMTIGGMQALKKGGSAALKAAKASGAGQAVGSKLAGNRFVDTASRLVNASTKGGHSVKSWLGPESVTGKIAGETALYAISDPLTGMVANTVLPDVVNPYLDSNLFPQDNDSQLAAEMQYRIINQDNTGTENADGLNQMYMANVQAQLEKLLAGMPQSQQAYSSPYGGIL